MTAERAALLRSSCKIRGHFQPEDLRATQEEPRPSLATVYRTLPLLEEAGIIRDVAAPGGKRSYEHVWSRTHHDHLVCTTCGRTVEFTYPAIEVLQEAVAREHGFVLTRHRLELFGACDRCSGRDDGTGRSEKEEASDARRR